MPQKWRSKMSSFLSMLGLSIVTLIFLLRSLKKTKILVIVLGDLTHSPRMSFHIKSLEPTQLVSTMSYSSTSTLKLTPPRKLDRKNYLANAIFRTISQFMEIFLNLASILPPKYILIQNPPSIPILAIIQVYSLICGTRIVIDWHNFGYSIMQLNSPSKFAVTFAYWYERIFGYRAFAHFCVSNSMKDFLVNEWKVRGSVHVLYDKPPLSFRKLSIENKHEVSEVT